MSTLATLVVKVVGDIGGLGAALNDASQSVRRAGADIASFGGSLTTRVTLPIVGAGAAAVMMGNQFNAGMANVVSLVPEAADEIAGMSDDVQQLAVDMGQATSDMTAGLYQQVSATGYGAESLEMLRVNAMAAAAGLSSTKEAIDLTSAVTKGYGDTTVEATQKVADLALRTVQLGQTTFPELAASMGRVVPIAANLGVAQEELFAVMATATGVTGGAAEVSTQLRGALQSLMAPTDTMSGLIESMGFASGQAMIEQLGLQGSIQAIVDAANASGTPLQSYMGSIEGQTLALALAGPQAETYKEKLTAMGSAAGTAQTAFDLQTQGVNAAGFAMQQTGIQLQTMAQDMGTALAPAVMAIVPYVQQFVTWVSGLVDQFTALDPQTQGIILGVIGLVAAIGPLLMILGPIVSGIGALMAVLGAILSPIGLVVLAIAGIIAVGVLVVQHWDEIKAWFANLWNQITTAVTTKIEEIRTAITGWLQGMWDAITGFDLGAAASALFGSVLTGIQTGISNAATAVLGWLDNTLVTIETFDLQAAAATFFGTTLPGIAEKAGQALTDVGTWLSDTATAIANSTLVEDAKTWFGTTLPAIAEKAGQALTDVGTWLSNTADRIRNFDLKAAALNAFHTILPGIYEKTGEALSNVGTWLGNVAQRIREKSFKSDTLNAFASVIAGIIEKASEIISNVGNFLEDIAETIRNFSLKEVAHQLIQGLIDGVREKWQELTDTLTGLLEGLVAWLKRLLGITSPSRVMADQIGRPMVEGIAMGAQEAAPGATAALAGIVTNMVSAMSAAASGLAALGGTSGTGGLISGLITFVSDLVRAFHEATAWITTAAVNVKAQSDAFNAAAQEMLQTLQAGIEILASIGDINIPLNAIDLVRPLIDFVSALVLYMHTQISWITAAVINVKAQSDAFNAAAQEMIETLAMGIDLVRSLEDFDPPVNVVAQIQTLIRIVSDLARIMASELVAAGMNVVVAARVFAETIQPVVGLIDQAVNSLRNMENLPPIDVDRVFHMIRQTLIDMVRILRDVQAYVGHLADAAAVFATRLLPAIKPVTDAMELLIKMGDWEPVDVDRIFHSIRQVLVDMVWTLRQAASYVDSIVVEAAAFAARLAPATAPMIAAMDLLVKMKDWEPVDVDRVFHSIRQVLVDMVRTLQQADEYVGWALPQATAFAVRLGGLVTAVSDVIELLVRLAEVDVPAAAATIAKVWEEIQAIIIIIRNGLMLDLGKFDPPTMMAGAFALGASWIKSLIAGIWSAMPELESVLAYIADLFPHSPAKAGPLRQAPDWEGYMLSGLDQAGDTLVRRLTAAMPAGGRLALAPAATGATGARGGQTINVTIHNPKGQPSERSLRRELLTLSQLGVLE